MLRQMNDCCLAAFLIAQWRHTPAWRHLRDVTRLTTSSLLRDVWLRASRVKLPCTGNVITCPFVGGKVTWSLDIVRLPVCVITQKAEDKFLPWNLHAHSGTHTRAADLTPILWRRGTVVERRSLTGELSLSCARPAADGWRLMWVNRPLQVSQLGQLSLSSFLGR